MAALKDMAKTASVSAMAQLSDHQIEKIKMWTAYYRSNPHRFAEDYLNVKLKTFQKMLLCSMMDAITTVVITCRGLGKTFLTALFCVIRCILYPGTQVCVCSKRRKQSRELIAKIQRILLPRSPLLQMEISNIVSNQYDTVVEFRNMSYITVTTVSDDSRGARCNILILDEFRMIDQNIYSSVLKKFLNVNRQPGYLGKQKYASLPTEENKEIFLSSAYYGDNWAYTEFRNTGAQMILGNRDFFACDFPYNLAVREGLLSRKRVLQERLDPNYNEITWMMEMDSLFFQGTTSSLYSFEDTEAARKIDFAFYPPEISGMISDKRVKIPQKMHNERRIMSVDVALMASSSTADNDATSIDINHMVMGTSLGSAVNNIVYRVSNEGYTTDEEALLIRRLFNQYACDWLVIDARGIGLGVLDKLLCDIYDPTNGMVYGALSCYNDPAIAARCKVKTAPKVIWAINATAQFNSQIALGLREALRSGKIRLLKSEEDFDEYANTLAGYAKLTPEQRQLFRLPHINTTLGNAELISLEYETRDSGVKVHERSGRRKDRYSSLAYNIEVAKAVERNYFEKQSNAAGFSAVVARFRQPQIYNHSGKGVNII